MLPSLGVPFWQPNEVLEIPTAATTKPAPAQAWTSFGFVIRSFCRPGNFPVMPKPFRASGVVVGDRPVDCIPIKHPDRKKEITHAQSDRGVHR